MASTRTRSSARISWTRTGRRRVEPDPARERLAGRRAASASNVDRAGHAVGRDRRRSRTARTSPTCTAPARRSAVGWAITTGRSGRRVEAVVDVELGLEPPSRPVPRRRRRLAGPIGGNRQVERRLQRCPATSSKRPVELHGDPAQLVARGDDLRRRSCPLASRVVHARGASAPRRRSATTSWRGLGRPRVREQADSRPATSRPGRRTARSSSRCHSRRHRHSSTPCTSPPPGLRPSRSVTARAYPTNGSAHRSAYDPPQPRRSDADDRHDPPGAQGAAPRPPRRRPAAGDGHRPRSRVRLHRPADRATSTSWRPGSGAARIARASSCTSRRSSTRSASCRTATRSSGSPRSAPRTSPRTASSTPRCATPRSCRPRRA